MSEPVDLLTLAPASPVDEPPPFHGALPEVGAGTKVVVTILFCGQGMANFIEFYDLGQKSPAPKATALVDFGVDLMFMGAERRSVLVEPAVTFVADKLAAMQKAGRTPRIDWAIFSHQDADHWALIQYLIWKVEEKKIPMKVGPIYYGGADWGKSASAAVGSLATFSDQPAKKQVIPLPDACSDYIDGPTGTLGELFHWGQVSVRVLAANVPVAEKKPDMVRNGTSAVVVVQCGPNTIVLPGDATYETFGFVNTQLEQWGSGSPVRPVYALSIPHHGSLRTFVEGYPKNVDYTLGTQFAKLLAAENAVASAGYRNRHHHPYKEIVAIFGQHTQTGDSHSYIAYGWADGAWAQYTTTNNVYTTVYKLENPPPYSNYDFWLSKSATHVAFGAHGPDVPAEDEAGHERPLTEAERAQPGPPPDERATGQRSAARRAG